MPTLKTARKIAVIGAGPIGLEAALAALERGYEVKVFERGSVGEAVRRWGHVRMFTPFGMNVSKQGLKRLKDKVRFKPETIVTGLEYLVEYLAPLAETLEDYIHTNAEVVSIARAALLKGEKAGAPERFETPFRLLLRRASREWNESADIIFDCSGTFFQPNHLGDGGTPAIGEAACREFIYNGAPDAGGRSIAQFAGTRVLVMGAGYSAATVIRDLAVLKLMSPSTNIIWATRNNEPHPCPRIPNDPLKERDQLIEQVNTLAGSGVLDFLPGHSVHSLSKTSDGLEVVLTNGAGDRKIVVDRLVAAVGYRPDLELTRELQTMTCYATEGSYNLGTELLREDHAARRFNVEMLLHPEPGYFALGMKSFGRSPGFLIHIGRAQIEAVLDWLEKKSPLKARRSGAV